MPDSQNVPDPPPRAYQSPSFRFFQPLPRPFAMRVLENSSYLRFA